MIPSHHSTLAGPPVRRLSAFLSAPALLLIPFLAGGPAAMSRAESVTTADRPSTASISGGAIPAAGFFKHVTDGTTMDPQLLVTGPSVVQAGEAFHVRVVAFDSAGDPADLARPPQLTLEGPVTGESNTETAASVAVSVEHVSPGVYRTAAPASLPYPGYYRFVATDPAGASLPCGLPMKATAEPPEQRVYWGDLHGHSTLSDGTGSPEDYHRWARDVAGLDFVALTDHNWALNDQKIETLRRICREFDRPGEFVPFFAFEWASGEGRKPPARGRPDHKHLIFKTLDEDFGPWTPRWHNTPTVADLWKLLEGRKVVAIPHHTGLPYDTFYGTDWSQHDPRFERLVEVFSDWGSSETPDDRYPLPEKREGNFIRDALARGYRLGFVGGSDTHTSRPGANAVPHAGHPYALTALTAIPAPELTRPGLWDALYNRNCHATSAGRRNLVFGPYPNAFHYPEGAPPQKLPWTATYTVVGASPIREIQIIKNDRAVATFPGRGWCQTVHWNEAKPDTEPAVTYYLRAEFEDTSMVWSNTVYMTFDHPDKNKTRR